MAKAIKIGTDVYRMRRGKLVKVPTEWVGNITTSETIRQRPSKRIHKLRRDALANGKRRLDWVDGRYDEIISVSELINDI